MTVLPDPYVVLPDGSPDGPGTQRNFEALARAFIDTGGRSLKLRVGTHSFSIVAAASASATKNHGMGSTPVGVVATTDGLNWFASADTFTSTQFNLKIRQYQAAVETLTVVTYWLAFG